MGRWKHAIISSIRSVSPVESLMAATLSAFSSSIVIPGGDTLGQW